MVTYRKAQTELVDRTLDVTRVACKFSKVQAVEKQHHRARAARAIVNGKLGHASSTDALSDDQLVRRAVEAAGVDVPDGLSFPEAHIDAAGDSTDVDRLSDRDMKTLANDILHDIRQGDPGVVIELELLRKQELAQVSNSRGGRSRLRSSWLEGEAWVERHAGDDVLVILDRFSTAGNDGTHAHFARRMARRLRWASRPAQPRAGTQAVILSPNAFASLLQPMLDRLSGTQAMPPGARGKRRRTGFAAHVGEQMFDARFSLCDDATLAGRPRSAAVDHEGMPSQRTALIERGVVAGFYHDLRSAAWSETRSTGNGWRWMMQPPCPTPTNVTIGTGEMRLSSMLRALGDGLLIDTIMDSDGESGLRGDFARTVVLGYQLRRGRAVGYVKGIGIAGNLYRSLRRIPALSCDGYWAGDVFAPYILLDDVRVTV